MMASGHPRYRRGSCIAWRATAQSRHVFLGVVDDRRDDVIELVTHRRSSLLCPGPGRLLLHPNRPSPSHRSGRDESSSSHELKPP